MALADVVTMVPVSRAMSCSNLQHYEITSGSQSEEGECSTTSSSGLHPSRSDFELSQGKDSGIECGSDFNLPDEETCRKIMKTVESYFSDANILKDQFLLKHVKRNKEGYVSIKLLSSFRKVRNLYRNWKVVAECVKKSELLALNSEGTKVRRIAPLPATCDKISSRTVLVYGLPGDKLSIESLSDVFSKCGEIALIRILKSNSNTSADVRKVINKNPDIQCKGCGLVEFEEIEGAKQALALDTGKENGIRIISVGNDQSNEKQEGKSSGDSSKQNSPKKKKRTRRSLHGSKSNLKDATNNDESKDQKPRRSSSGSLGCGSSSSPGCLSSSPVDNWFSRRHSYNVPNGPIQEPASTTSSFASLKNRGHHKGSKDRLVKNSNSNKSKEIEFSDTSEFLSPWRIRRELMRNENSSVANLTSTVPLLRTPKGPDGTRGFQNTTRQLLPPTAE